MTFLTDAWLRAQLRQLSAIVLIILLSACGNAVELVTNLPEQEANEVLATLLNAGVNAQKATSKTGVNIVVDQSEVAHAITTLNAQGLPRKPYQQMGDVFKKENLISSPLEEHARYLYALSQELERTLTQIDGVAIARVHVVLPEVSRPGEPVLPSSASVFLKNRIGYRIENVLPQVRTLVANSIPGLSTDRVAVVLVPAMTNASAESHWETVVGLRLEPESASRLRVIAGILGAVVFLLALAVIWLMRGSDLWIKMRTLLRGGDLNDGDLL